MRLLIPVAFSCCLALAQDVALAVRQQASEIRLSKDISLQDGSPRYVLQTVLASANVSGGIAMVSNCDSSAPVSFRIPEGYSLADALDSFSVLDPTYVWTMQLGVVDVLPRSNVPSVLHVFINHFEWMTSDSIHLTVSRLFQMDAVKKRATDQGFVGALETGPGIQKPPRVINGKPEPPSPGRTRSIDDLDLIHALNTVVSSYCRSLWWYEERTCGPMRTYGGGAMSN